MAGFQSSLMISSKMRYLSSSTEHEAWRAETFHTSVQVFNSIARDAELQPFEDLESEPASQITSKDLLSACNLETSNKHQIL